MPSGVPVFYLVFSRDLHYHFFMKRISDAEATRRIQAWADVTMLSLDLKRAALRQKYPQADDRELSEMVREEFARYKDHDER